MAFSRATRGYAWDDDGNAIEPSSARTTEGGGAALTVTQALMQAKRALENVRVTIIGEISEFSNKPGYKAVYFTVTDESSALPCLMWMTAYKKSGIELRKGMLVEMTGAFSLYAAKGRMNFDVKSIKPAGEGDLRMKVAQIARKLRDEGLMDESRKKAIPPFPERIAVVTSPRGKAIHDVLRTLRRRYPLATVLVAGVPVEGADAPTHIIEGLRAAIAAKPDAILLVRGGGSYEDLMPFNDEKLARMVSASPIPIVTGIGHEPDNSIADMVADRRASTPTAAAEAVAPDMAMLEARLANTGRQMATTVQHRLDYLDHMLDAFASRPLFAEPASALFAGYGLALDSARERLSRALPESLARDGVRIDALKGRMLTVAPHLFDRQSTAIRMGAARLQDLSPLNILSRGYAIAYDSGEHVLRSIDQTETGARASVRLSDGWIDCTVDGSRRMPDGNDTVADAPMVARD